jgi:hypothetical protein
MLTLLILAAVADGLPAIESGHLEETICAILAQIVPSGVRGVMPECYLSGLGLILSQNAHW